MCVQYVSMRMKRLALRSPPLVRIAARSRYGSSRGSRPWASFWNGGRHDMPQTLSQQHGRGGLLPLMPPVGYAASARRINCANHPGDYRASVSTFRVRKPFVLLEAFLVPSVVAVLLLLLIRPLVLALPAVLALSALGTWSMLRASR